MHFEATPSGGGSPVFRNTAKRRLRSTAPTMSDPPQLFDDTSSSPRSRSEEYPSQGMPEPDSQSFLADPMSKLAMTYGSSLAIQGKEMMDQNIDRFIPVSKLKYYFAVDTVYVGKKLGLLVFPYKHPDWEVRYQQDTPVAPRFDVNAPDLYIPAMAFITYILLAGLALGTQDRFSPEMLGVLASSAFVCLIIEVFIILLALYLVSVNTDLTLVDLFAFSGYKYVGMIVGVLSGLLFGRTGYYLMLSWCCVAIIVFMINLAELHQSLEDSTTRVCKELTSGGRAGAYIHSAEHAIYPHPRLIASDRRPTSTSCTSLRPQKKGSRKNLQLSDGTSVITWFKIRTLRLKILAQAAAEGVVVRGARNQLRMYLTMAIAAAQPVFMFWLTSHLVR